MMRLGKYTTLQREAALADAEQRLDHEGHSRTVKVTVNKLKEMPELFQPREFSGEKHTTVNSDHVKSLAQAIGIYGSIDPPLVVKLKHKGWIIVDGHHTLAAYKKKGMGDEQITCEWFPGTVREAMDESMLRNVKDKLSVPRDDKMQEGWKRVLMGGYTAEHIKAICGISVRQVRYMNGVKRVALEKTKEGEQFRERLRETTKYWLAVPNLRDELDVVNYERSAEDAAWRLKQLSWLRARAIYKGMTVKEITEEEEAVMLERALNSKLEDRLKRNPRVTALALRLHDRMLPEQLMDAWSELESKPETLRDAKDIAKHKAEEYRQRSQKAARAAAERHAVEKTLKRALAPSTPPKAARDPHNAPEPGLRQERARILGLLRERLTDRTAKGPDGTLGA